MPIKRILELQYDTFQVFIIDIDTFDQYCISWLITEWTKTNLAYSRCTSSEYHASINIVTERLRDDLQKNLTD